MSVNPAEDIVNVWLQDIQGYFTRQNVNVPKKGRMISGRMVYGGKGKEIDILGIKNDGKRIWVEVSVSPNPYLAKKDVRVANAIDMVNKKFDPEKETLVRKIFAYSGESGHRFRRKPATCRSEATLGFHFTSGWPA